MDQLLLLTRFLVFVPFIFFEIRVLILYQEKMMSIIDTKALHRILSQPSIYGKSPDMKYILGSILGQGLLIVENQQHRQQRHIMVGITLPSLPLALIKCFRTPPSVFHRFEN